jgi:NAD+ synthase
MNQSNRSVFSRELLYIDDIESRVENLTRKIKNDVTLVLKRKGAVVGLSGGIDSSVTLALTVKALGAENVLGVLLPEKDSSEDSKMLAMKLAEKFAVQTIEEPITDALEGLGCYRRRDEAVSAVFPEYNPNDYNMKIGIDPASIRQNLPPLFSLTIVDRDGITKSKILPIKEYLQIVAASNFKQRCRMSMLYYHAERLHYSVIGTPNKHEVEQGFFVKNGDGGADLMPIGNFYKTQVYQLAEYLGIPEEIVRRTPTSDTYSAEQTQEEFFFQLPFREMDILWYGYENGYAPSEVADPLGKTEQEIKSVFNNFMRKQKTTEYLRMAPIKDYV